MQEKDGRWSLPGGWCDVNVSVGENTVKEVREEAGLTVIPVRVIAVQDRERHNLPRYVYGVCKIFVQCGILQRTSFLRWQKRKTTPGRSACASPPPALHSGRRCWNEEEPYGP